MTQWRDASINQSINQSDNQYVSQLVNVSMNFFIPPNNPTEKKSNSSNVLEQNMSQRLKQ